LDVDGPGWLIQQLWSADGVGVIGGPPKCCKTWLALDLAVSVSSGTPALGRFLVAAKGPVLFYGAEDAPARLRDRIQGMASTRNLSLSDLDLRLIVADTLRLDTERDRSRLRATLQAQQPRLLILDPLVRLHRIDENSAGEMSALLSELRALQREYRLAVILVHHLRKNAARRGLDGLSLRGSSDLHAWGDTNLYLRRQDRQILLTGEHRSAPSPPSCLLELVTEPAAHLRIVEGGPAEHEAPSDVAEKIVALLTTAGGPMTREAIRAALHTRNAIVGEALVRLRTAERVRRSDGGFRLSDSARAASPALPAKRNDSS
jgi:hypothetical protein